MLPVSLGCTFLLPLRYSLTLVCPVSCVPYVTSFSGLYFFIASLVFSNIYLSCVLCTQSCLWIVLFLITPSVFSKIPVSCVPYVASFSGLSLFIAPSVFSNIYLSCVFCTLCCQFLWIVLFHYPFGIL
jgi:hypothetical protein